MLSGNFAHSFEFVICRVERVLGVVVLTVAPEIVRNGATLILSWHMPGSPSSGLASRHCAHVATARRALTGLRVHWG